MDLEKIPQQTTSSPGIKDDTGAENGIGHEAPLAELQKRRWERSWPVIACGAGLFSDGKFDTSAQCAG
jgi:hypothetical protein